MIKNNTNLVIVLVFLFIIGLFYWFQWRPSEVKKACHIYAVEKAREDGQTREGIPDGKFRDEDYKFRLDYCHEREGLK